MMKSRFAVGADAPKSLKSRRSKVPIFSSARSARVREPAVHMRWSCAASQKHRGCIDHRVNGLGTCKHIEGVIAALHRRGAKTFREVSRKGSERIEIFVDRREVPKLAITRPASRAAMQAAWTWLEQYLRADGTLDANSDKIESLIEAWRSAPTKIRRLIRISRHLGTWLDRIKRERARLQSRATFLADVEAGRASLDLLRLKLLPYQREGMLHLAFGERVLLADEMGLGKTVQAIAACELLARREGIARVLIVCPASLKAEWEEQIARFSERGTKLIFGPRAQRLAGYGEPAFFTIVNYEQVLADAQDINSILAPDVVVLDESPAHQELANQDRAPGQGAPLALRLRPDRHADREPDRRALFNCSVS
jgi:hypothetical protein